MKQHEKDAQIAALRKQLTELEATPVEPEQPLCVMPGRMRNGGRYWVNCIEGESSDSIEDRDSYDEKRFASGNYFSSERQASADAHAVSVMRLMRRMPGVVGADDEAESFRVVVVRNEVHVEKDFGDALLHEFMFPCYATVAQARAAIEAVGGEDALRRCAEYWSGVMK